MIRIGMILDKSFPPDIRVEKEVDALISSGFEVFLLALTNTKLQPKVETIKGIHVRRPWPRNNNLIINKLIHSFYEHRFYYLTFRNLLAEKKIKEFVRENDIDILHVHDLPLLRSTMIIGNQFDIVTIVDLHENYPDAIRVSSYNLSWERRNLYRNYTWWSAYERRVLSQVPYIIVVVEEMKKRLVKIGINPAKITLVSNTQPCNFRTEESSDVTLTFKYSNYYIISYIGSLGPHRGIDVAIKAMSLVVNKIPSVKLLILGSGEKEYVDYLKKLTKDLGLEGDVEFLGQRPFNDMPSYMSISSVGLIPFHPSPQTHASAPHKTFQYMLMGVPIIVSDCASLKRIVGQAHCGLTFTADDPRSLAEKIISLYNDPDFAKSLGENGRKAAEGTFSWEADAARLVSLYKRIARMHLESKENYPD